MSLSRAPLRCARPGAATTSYMANFFTMSSLMYTTPVCIQNCSARHVWVSTKGVDMLDRVDSMQDER